MATPSGTASRASSDRLPAHYAYLAAGTCLDSKQMADVQAPTLPAVSLVLGGCGGMLVRRARNR